MPKRFVSNLRIWLQHYSDILYCELERWKCWPSVFWNRQVLDPVDFVIPSSRWEPSSVSICPWTSTAAGTRISDPLENHDVHVTETSYFILEKRQKQTNVKMQKIVFFQTCTTEVTASVNIDFRSRFWADCGITDRQICRLWPLLWQNYRLYRRLLMWTNQLLIIWHCWNIPEAVGEARMHHEPHMSCQFP